MYGFCSSNAFWCLLLLRIKPQPSISFKSVAYKIAFNVVFKSSKNEKIIVTLMFIFVFIYFIGAILSQESRQKPKVWEIYKRGDGY